MTNASSSTTNSPSILLVDDDAAMARSVQRELRRAFPDSRVEAVTDGLSALNVLNRERFDIALVDWVMSPMSGETLLMKIQPLANAPACVVLSGHLDIPTTVTAMRAGAAEVLQKPVDTESLKEHVLAVLARVARRFSLTSSSQRDPESTDVASALIGNSLVIRGLRDQIRRVGNYRDVPILIVGETGTGKQLVAEALHRFASPDSPFVAFECASQPDSRVEAALLGVEPTDFTATQAIEPGAIQRAAGGTLFLNEVGQLPPSVQPKLLQLIDHRGFESQSGRYSPKARIISSTNQPLARTDSPVRPDLYYRLAGYTIAVPPLRERTQDICALAKHFLREAQERYGRGPGDIRKDAVEALMSHRWPGNVRELRRFVEAAAVHCSGAQLTAEDVWPNLQEAMARGGGAGSGAYAMGHFHPSSPSLPHTGNTPSMEPRIGTAQPIDPMAGFVGGPLPSAPPFSNPAPPLPPSVPGIPNSMPGSHQHHGGMGAGVGPGTHGGGLPQAISRGSGHWSAPPSSAATTTPMYDYRSGEMRRVGVPPPSSSEAQRAVVNSDLQIGPGSESQGSLKLRDVERHMIEDAFRRNSFNVSKTARELGIPRSTLRDKLRKFGLR